MRDQANWQLEATTACAGVGGMLRDARDSLGLSLPDIAKDTRVRLAYLEAIEAGRFHDLPGRTYVPAFLRAYAKRVNLDSERVLEAYRAIDAAPKPTAAFNFPAAPKERRTPKAALLLASCALMFGAYVTWHAMTREPGNTAQVVAPVPDRLKPAPVAAAPDVAPPAAPAPAPALVQITGTPAPTTSPAAAPSVTPPPAPVAGAPAPSPAPVAVAPVAPPPAPVVTASPGQAQAATPPRQDAGGQPPVAPPEASRPPEAKPFEAKVVEPPKPASVTAPAGARPVTILPKTNSWLELRGPNGEVLASTFVRAGEPYTVPEGIGYRLTPDAARP